MFTIRRSSSIECPTLFVNASRHTVYGLIIGGAMLLGLSGCGQKGELYLAEASSQTVKADSAVDVPASTSNPQDAAFAGSDDDEYQKQRYLEQQQVLPEPSDDPNDY